MIITMFMVNTVVLIGMRGCGKSHFGTCLSKELGWAKIDIDDEIERNTQKTITQYIKEFGIDAFRQREHEVCKRVSLLKNAVVSTGGGSITFERNRPFLTKNAVVVFLFAPFRELVKRIKGDASRPALTKQSSIEEEIKELWNQRKDIYFSSADIVFCAQEGLSEDSRKNVEYNAKVLAQKIKQEISKSL